MPDVTPSGLFSLPVTRLQTLLANSATWQTWTETETAEEAAGRIHLIEADTEGDNAVDLPCAVIWQGDDFSLYTIATGERNHFADQGSLMLWIEAEIPETYRDDPRNTQVWFMNQVGAVLLDMIELAGSNTYLNVTGMELTYGPSESDERKRESIGYRIACEFKVSWGRFNGAG